LAVVIPTPSVDPSTDPFGGRSATVTLGLRDENGYTAVGMFRYGDIRPASAGLMNGSMRLGSACSVNSQTDAVIAFTMTVKNTTTGFSASPTFRFVQQYPGNEFVTGPGDHAEVGYGQPKCISLDFYRSDNQVGFVPKQPLAPDTSASVDGFIVVPNYFSPNFPNGNRQGLVNVILTFQGDFTTNPADSWTITTTDGVIDSQNFKNIRRYAVPLLVGTSGGCLPRVVTANC
jgi:hypothetical protein